MLKKELRKLAAERIWSVCFGSPVSLIPKHPQSQDSEQTRSPTIAIVLSYAFVPCLVKALP